MRQRGIVLDGRGRPVRVYRPSLRGLERDDAETFPQHDFRLLRRRLRREDPVGCFSNEALLCVLILAALGALVWTTASSGWDLRRAAGYGVILIILLLALRVSRQFLPLSPRRYPHMVMEAMLTCGRCAACGFDLKDLPPEADGCRVCPECGAAWVLRPRPAYTAASSASGS